MKVVFSTNRIFLLKKKIELELKFAMLSLMMKI